MRAILVAILLTGCVTNPAASIPVPVSCAPADSPAPPQTLADPDLALLGDRELVLTIAEERLLLLDFAGKAGAILAACR